MGNVRCSEKRAEGEGGGTEVWWMMLEDVDVVALAWLHGQARMLVVGVDGVGWDWLGVDQHWSDQ